MSLLLRQIWTLTVKNLLITLVRPRVTTVLRAFILPVVFIVFMSASQSVLVLSLD